MGDSVSLKQDTAAPGAVSNIQDAQRAGHTQGDDITGLVNKNNQLLDELKKLKGRLAKIDENKQAADEAALKEQNKWKELYEKEKAAHEVSKGEITKMTRKHNLTEAAAKAGMDIRYMPMLNDVEYDEDHKVKDSEGYFNRVKKDFPLFFESQQTKPIPYTDANKTYVIKPGTKVWTPEEIRAMPVEEYASLSPEVKAEIKRQEQAWINR